MNTASNRVAGWRLEDIDDNLAADFDGSLSGLGVDLSVASYNMRPTLNATTFNPPYSYSFNYNNGHSAAPYVHFASNHSAHFVAPQAPASVALELTRCKTVNSRNPASSSSSWRSSSPWEIEGRLGNNTSPAERASSEGRTVTSLTNHGHAHESEANYSHPFQHMLHQHSGWSTVDGSSGTGPIAGGGVETGSASSLASSSSNEGIPASGNIQQSNSSSHIDAYHGEKYKYGRLNEADGNADNRFQYVLAAATSIATKVNEESLTYLNQGQPYEIKMKKLGDLSNFRGKLLRSVVRLCFHERRLQYMEREQIAAWRMSRPGDRITEIDVPLSYGIYDVVQDNSNLNVVEFVWDPTKEVGVYIKVNCISTEFTPKKHGGEKGVPFRIQVETYSHADGDGSPIRLHVAGCQIKVFKLKGADRKHKQDREKIFKRPMSEQEKYQPSCECTILSEIPLELVYTSAIVPVGSTGNGNHVSAAPATASTVTAITSVPTSIAVAPSPTATVSRTYSPSELHKSKSFTSEGCAGESPLEHDASNVESPTSMMGSGGGALFQYYMHPLSVDASAQQTAQWLQSNRFSCHVRTFGKFAGADILRLSREDLIQICGLPDGIRLFNALHAKAMAPRLTLYLTQDQSHVFHAIFLENLSCVELGNKLAALVQLPPQHIMDVFIEGPCCIHVLVTDEVVQNMKDESMFNIELLPESVKLLDCPGTGQKESSCPTSRKASYAARKVEKKK
nr:EOG090X0AJ3 [Leptodora kindtii]